MWQVSISTGCDVCTAYAIMNKLCANKLTCYYYLRLTVRVECHTCGSRVDPGLESIHISIVDILNIYSHSS